MNPELDAELIAEVCRLAITATPFASEISTRAIFCAVDETGVTVVIASPIGRTAAAKALRQHGYRLDDIPADDPASGIAVRIAGWSREGLTARRDALTSVITGMESALPVTIEAAAHRYAYLQGRIDSKAATYGMADALRANVARRVAQRVGPLQRRRPTGITVPDDLRSLLTEIDRLTAHSARLLAEHWHVAVRTADRLDQLHHRQPPEQARERAVAELCGEITQGRRATALHDPRTRPVRRTPAVAEPTGHPELAASRGGSR